MIIITLCLLNSTGHSNVYLILSNLYSTSRLMEGCEIGLYMFSALLIAIDNINTVCEIHVRL